jgi:hypothetical protein
MSRLGLVAGEELAGDDGAIRVHAAGRDNLLVEVDAVEVHRGATDLGELGNARDPSSCHLHHMIYFAK